MFTRPELLPPPSSLSFAPRPSPLAACTLCALLCGACVTEDVDPIASAGSGGASGGASAGASGAQTAGTSGASMGGDGGGGTAADIDRDDPSFGMGTACPPVQQASITDFTYAAASTPAPDAGASTSGPDAAAPTVATHSFGDFTSTLSGSTFVYPGEGASFPLTSDVSQNNWHITGSIGDYSGFGIAIANCNRVDASAYDGISFVISGSVPMGSTITLNVGTADNDITHVWLNRVVMPDPPAAPNFGECVPATGQFDGSCAAPNVDVPVTSDPTVFEVTWAELDGGSPSASVNPAEITSISWNFLPPPGVGTATVEPYDVDVIIDDLRFTGGS